MCIHTLSGFFWGGWRGELRLPFPSSATKKKRSVLHIVPLFDGDECVEMQGMIYDLASFNCERQNAFFILEDLR